LRRRLSAQCIAESILNGVTVYLEKKYFGARVPLQRGEPLWRVYSGTAGTAGGRHTPVYSACVAGPHQKHSIRAAQVTAIDGRVSTDDDVLKGHWTHPTPPLGR
jgi:hypothetical protein